MLFTVQLACKMDRKSSERSIENRSLERPPDTQNRSQICPWTLSARIVAPKGVPKASRKRLGSFSGRPQRASGPPGGSPSAPFDARKIAQERPGARRGDQNQCQVASRNEKIEFSWHGSLADRLSIDFHPNFA